MSLTIGETFAEYQILRLLGSGGMGHVYLARHPRLPREDALKVLRPDVSSDTSFRERFVREADLAAGLRHPHIVGVHDRGEHDGRLWIAMDYIDGTDAAQLVAEQYPTGMPVDMVITIVTAIASALDYAHRKGLMHRDVKPANIIVADLDTDEPNVSLADFGIARPLDDTGGITTTNMTVGTVAYAAPEQLMGDSLDGRADQYALASTAYHLLTGSQLFPNSNPAVVISRHLNRTPPGWPTTGRNWAGSTLPSRPRWQSSPTIDTCRVQHSRTPSPVILADK
ncbi:serine/threonine-protein kinase [Mycolicibacter sinensis]